MALDFARYALTIPEILLPGEQFDLSKWAAVACDQFTSKPEYWRAAEDYAGDAPSALNLIYPEAFLSEGDARIEKINRAMADYAKRVLTRSVKAFVLVERSVAPGQRLGLMAAVDLEAYDYRPGSHSLIRATEGTILSRIPPRVRIRKDAPLELTHVMMLADDPEKTLIEPMYAARETFEKLYDFELMMGGGHIRGWRVDDNTLPGMQTALERLYEKAGGLLFAVGDGNHSLATARACWLDIRDSLSESERANHPARYALVEIVNLHDPALVFEPIHRALFGVDGGELRGAFAAWLNERGMALDETDEGNAMFFQLDANGRTPLMIGNIDRPLPLDALQEFLDGFLEAHSEASIDYIHGEDELERLAREGASCFLLKAMDKFKLFDGVRVSGALPRKTFSMGEANEKRYYLESRRIRPEA